MDEPTLTRDEKEFRDSLVKARERVKAQGGRTKGLPPAPRLPRPLDDQREYHRRFGAALKLQPFDARPAEVTLDEKRGKQVAALYDRMAHNPGDPAVKAAYDQFKKEILLQYKHMTDRGLKVEPWTQPGQPYESSKHMADSVAKHHHLYYFRTDPSQMPADHPLMEQAPGHPEGTSYNDLFRAVHDYFGRAVHRNSFGPLGEIKAWVYHARMFSPLARQAMTTETMGQNSWVNYGPHDPQKLPLKDRPFAPQKAGVMKLARSASQGLGGAVRQSDTDNHRKRVALARRVLAEAGLRARASAVIAHTAAGSEPSVSAAADHVESPQLAIYAGAMLGLMTQQKRVTVFRPGEGEDTLHVFDSPHPAAHVAEYLRSAGVASFTTESKAGGTRVMTVAPLDRLDPDTLARGLHARHTALRGRADRIGSSAGPDGSSQSAKAARAAYRQVIADAERAAGLGGEPAPPAGQEPRVLPARLARRPKSERDQMIDGVARDHPGVFADWMQDHDMPGAHIARAHATNLGYTDRAAVFDPVTGERREWYTTVPGNGDVFFNWMGAGTKLPPVYTVGIRHLKDDVDDRNPNNNVVHHRTSVRSLRHLYALLSDFSPAVRRSVVRQVARLGSGLPRTSERDGPVRLARAGDTTGRDFERAIAENPDEDTNWLVYADHLDETGGERQAARIRYWIGLRQYARNTPLSVGARRPTTVHMSYDLLPEWVGRLVASHHARPLVTDGPGARMARQALHLNDLHALDLLPAGRLDAAHERTMQHIVRFPADSPEDRRVHLAIRATTVPSTTHRPGGHIVWPANQIDGPMTTEKHDRMVRQAEQAREYVHYNPIPEAAL